MQLIHQLNQEKENLESALHRIGSAQNLNRDEKDKLQGILKTLFENAQRG